MSQDTKDPSPASAGREDHDDHGGRPWLISVAFVTALLFGPLVIATGLLTARAAPHAELRGESFAALRPTFDADAR